MTINKKDLLWDQIVQELILGHACYRNNGPLTITDCNSNIRKNNPDFFPKYFGKNKNQKVSKAVAKKNFYTFKKVQKDYP